MSRVRGLADDQHHPPNLLEEEVGRLDGRAPGLRARSVGTRHGLKPAIGTLA
jgi:hypothetical protein